MTEPPTLRIGMVNFINTSLIYLPWVEMGTPEHMEVIEGPPTLLNRLLSESRLDMGLVSSYEYWERSGDYYIMPGFSISATGPVGSVILFSNSNPMALDKEKIFLTSQSSTSVNLLKILLEDFLYITPCYHQGTIGELDGCPGPCGYLAIGDEALRLKKSHSHLFSMDLAEAWIARTGLPFVFALWVVRKEAWRKKEKLIRSLHHFLLGCLRMGQENIEAISSKVAIRIPMGPKECIEYLGGIDLELDERKEQGLARFFRILDKRGAKPPTPITYLPGW